MTEGDNESWSVIERRDGRWIDMRGETLCESFGWGAKCTLGPLEWIGLLLLVWSTPSNAAAVASCAICNSVDVDSVADRPCTSSDFMSCAINSTGGGNGRDSSSSSFDTGSRVGGGGGRDRLRRCVRYESEEGVRLRL